MILLYLALYFINFILGSFHSLDITDPRKFAEGAVSNKQLYLKLQSYYFSSLHVFDPKGYLSTFDFIELNEKIFKINSEIRFEILVIIIDKIRGRETPKEFIQDVFNRLEVDDPIRNNGTMLLFVAENKKIEFQVGKDVQDLLTTEYCESIVSEMIPYLNLSRYDQALRIAIESLHYRIVHPKDLDELPHTNQSSESHPSSKSSSSLTSKFLILTFPILIVVIAVTFFVGLYIGWKFIKKENGKNPKNVQPSELLDERKKKIYIPPESRIVELKEEEGWVYLQK